MPIKLIQSKSRLPESLQYNAWAPLSFPPVAVPALVQTSTAIQGIKPLGLNYKITHISYTLSTWEVLPPSAAPPVVPSGPSAVPLATASTYGGLAGSTITNTGATTINGDLGLSPGASITGSPTVTGATNIDNPAAVTAKNDLTTAYNNAASRAGAISIPADIGGLILAPGLYAAASTLGITGTVTLDAAGNPNSVWIFQVPTALTTATSSNVLLINGANANNVYWQVGSSATLGVTSTFNGTIMALMSITVDTSTVVVGRMLARNGALTMDTNTITVPTPVPPPSGGSTGAPTTGHFAAGKMGFNVVSGVGAYEGAGASSSYAYITLSGVFAPYDTITITIANVAYVYTVNGRSDVSLENLAAALTSFLNRQTLNGNQPGFNTLYRANSLGAEIVIQTLAYSTATPTFSVAVVTIATGAAVASGAAMIAGVAGALPVNPVSDTTNLGIVPSQVAAVGTALFPVDLILPLFNASQADLVGTIYALENFDANWPTLAEMTLRITADGVVAGGLNVILWGVPNDVHPMQPEEAATAFHLSQIVL